MCSPSPPSVVPVHRPHEHKQRLPGRGETPMSIFADQSSEFHHISASLAFNYAIIGGVSPADSYTPYFFQRCTSLFEKHSRGLGVIANAEVLTACPVPPFDETTGRNEEHAYFITWRAKPAIYSRSLMVYRKLSGALYHKRSGKGTGLQCLREDFNRTGAASEM